MSRFDRDCFRIKGLQTSALSAPDGRPSSPTPSKDSKGVGFPEEEAINHLELHMLMHTRHAEWPVVPT